MYLNGESHDRKTSQMAQTGIAEAHCEEGRVAFVVVAAAAAAVEDAHAHRATGVAAADAVVQHY